MRSLELKYGCNPNQKPSRIFMEKEGELPLTVLNGHPGYINLLDALNGWQLVSQLKEATGLCAAASFKHVSPAGAAVAIPLSEDEQKMYFVTPKMRLSPLAVAYTRARGADRMSSFGDFVSLSDRCDLSTAKCLKREVSDGVIAPCYDDDALSLLRGKKEGQYIVLQIDPAYQPEAVERRQVFGITFEQGRNTVILDQRVLSPIVTKAKVLSESAKTDLVVALVTLKYTQSNSVCYAQRGQTIGVGAGQQSRIQCTRLAGSKADLWHLRQSEKVLDLPFLPTLSRNEKDNVIEQYLADEPETSLFDQEAWKQYFTTCPSVFTHGQKKELLSQVKGVSLASDAFFPFKDNIERAYHSGVTYVVQPGGSLRDDLVIQACDEHDMVMICNKIRLFHH
ncbi:MAG: phosphoribosylaminoimidazolecarboxamide formyltransferase [Sphaerochaetaceae bacterium]